VKRAPARPRERAAPRRTARGAWPLVAVLLALHFALAAWVATRNSVTFDENFHLSAGAVALARADFHTSYAQPPLARELAAVAALAAGARLPERSVESTANELRLAEAFMRANADCYQRIFVAARLVTALLSTLLGFMIWRLARRWYGERAGLVALLAWTLSPEALAHGSVVGVDIPTALATFGAAIAALAWLRTGRWRRWAACAAWVAAAFLVRFSAVQLFPTFVVLALVLAWRGRLASVPRTLAGLALLGVVAGLAVHVGYYFQGTLSPLAGPAWLSERFQSLAHRWPHLRVPLPSSYVDGLDYLSYLAQPGLKLSYFLGHARDAHDWRYFPVAILVKWPLGLLALLALAIAYRVRGRGARLDRELALLVPAGAVLITAVATNLDYGIRYLLPALPFLCVWMSAPAAEAVRKHGVRRWAAAALVLVLLEGVESVAALPYPLAFFNVFAGGRGGGDRIVNDSNVDWGQGLIALRDELRKRGTNRVQLVYHGTTDPALYGLDYVPFFSGPLDSTVQYFAVSSYFMVGLPARLMLKTGPTEMRRYDFSALAQRQPDARPAGCMYLYKVR
jgi:hypothetical protein